MSPEQKNKLLKVVGIITLTALCMAVCIRISTVRSYKYTDKSIELSNRYTDTAIKEHEKRFDTRVDSVMTISIENQDTIIKYLKGLKK